MIQKKIVYLVITLFCLSCSEDNFENMETSTVFATKEEITILTKKVDRLQELAKQVDAELANQVDILKEQVKQLEQKILSSKKEANSIQETEASLVLETALDKTNYELYIKLPPFFQKKAILLIKNELAQNAENGAFSVNKEDMRRIISAALAICMNNSDNAKHFITLMESPIYLGEKGYKLVQTIGKEKATQYIYKNMEAMLQKYNAIKLTQKDAGFIILEELGIYYAFEKSLQELSTLLPIAK